jgi:glycosyltransferase involved in cell wall biosynthesis
MLDLSVVIPCYNEASHIETSAVALLEVLDQTRYEYEVIFVDDCSQDETRTLIEKICAGSPRCRYIWHERNRGRGGAFKTGFAASTGRVTGFIDIDLEVHALYIPSCVNLIENHGYDVVTGYRHYLLRQTGGLGRHVLSVVYRLLCKFLLDSGVRDTETGCKFFRRETAEQAVLSSNSDGWFWDTEVMIRAALMGLRIRETPVLFLRRWDKPSTVRVFRDSWRQLVELNRFRPKVGLSLLDKSPIYWTCVGYDLAMRALCGRQYREIYAEVMRRIPEGSSVVDVCCGTGVLFRYGLQKRGCEYLGLDFNGHFVMGARKRGIRARFFNLLAEAVPSADYVVMCSSLYHVQRMADEIFANLMAAARRAVIISEPVHNLSTSVPRWARGLVASLANPGVGEYSDRFDLAGFRAFAERHGASEFAYRPGQRNAIAVFTKS